MATSALAQAAAPKSAAQAKAADASAQTATQAYLAYRLAFDKATKVEDLAQYQTADVKKQIEATPPADRAQMFGMMKIMGAMTGMKVTKEERTAAGATLTAEGVNSDKKKLTGTVKMVKEAGVWKVAEESWPM
ncbi:MAG: hypothetical protein ABI652_01675 [Acidobacteriota bacterium]